MIVRFLFKGKQYIVEEFDLDFKQDVSDSGKPNSFPYGGQMAITISDIPDDNINSWMMDTHRTQDGEIHFLSNEGMIREGALLQIHFKEAYCVNYRKVMNPKGSGVLTTLVISPRIIKMGNEEFRNSWSE
ncbi:type VI secretion system tube protein TssD [Prevotella sp. 10(H)]|uniref:type VI secretion system tube protein TssD n=1 Tax=Prevotella sp. 10(H) TaxID=1158294 RepID=UPI0012DCCDD9|nr:type VI secretion system tube protein TssD [Prevotella sp. 10(H)]